MTFDEPTLKGKVQLGAALLDRLRPGWATRIAADQLAMDSCDRCVLGQLEGDYVRGFRALCRELPLGTLHHASDYGFTLPESAQEIAYQIDGPDGGSRLFKPLADLWREEVRSRTSAT